VVKAWFPEGADDPNVCLLSVQPQNCYYWDTETGKMVKFFKMAASVVAEKRLADGAEGKLDL
jgi:general stress protein 26